tara:strand:- start:2864 stop:3364 length:501 start_codon:yes stop_codon:yes gene_type:complete
MDAITHQMNDELAWSQIEAQRQRVNEKKVFVTELHLNPPAKDAGEEVLDEWMLRCERQTYILRGMERSLNHAIEIQNMKESTINVGNAINFAGYNGQGIVQTILENALRIAEKGLDSLYNEHFNRGAWVGEVRYNIEPSDGAYDAETDLLNAIKELKEQLQKISEE